MEEKTYKKEYIRNFSIIAHIDHGKSTLADRLLELTHTVTDRIMKNQILDDMDLERERGITIKARACTLKYIKAGKSYFLNLIDTPGHVDFSYEVSRSLSACEGVILLIDASQGIEAQTLSNFYLAYDNDLVIIPVLNKIDLQNTEINKILNAIEETFLIEKENVLKISAKTGVGVDKVLDEIIEKIPPPVYTPYKPLKALIFDSMYNNYRGVITYIRVYDGTIKKDDEIIFMSSGEKYIVEEVGIFTPDYTATKELNAGDVGYLVAGIKDISNVKIGDTITLKNNPAKKALTGFKEVKPMVFCGLYPADGGMFEHLRDSLEKLKLNDASFDYQPESSNALGFGFRCGFLGLLHMDIIRERLEREYDLDLITTAPEVVYKITLTDGNKILIENPSKFPARQEIDFIEEPILKIFITTPVSFMGPLMDLCKDRRGDFIEMDYITPERVVFSFYLPLNEIVIDFYDKLKSLSKGYASLDYHFHGYRKADMVKVDILLNKIQVDALSFVCHKDNAYKRGLILVTKLRKVIPRHLFEIPIQAAIGSKIISRETIKPLKKNVTSKCYGGDITRKRKLLEKQKEGKRRMKNVGRVTIPQEAFLAVLEIDE